MMKISSCVTFFGNCRKAVDFYMQVFETTNVKIVTFGDKLDMFNFELTPKCKNLIYRAELNIESGNSIFSFVMADSPVLVFETDLNSNQNNRDNITFEITTNDKDWIEKTFNKLLIDDGKKNTSLEKRESEYDLSGSVIDKFGVCWILNYYNQVGEKDDM